MNQSTKACAISKQVRLEVIDRDNGLCIFCQREAVDIMHFRSRGNLGLGIVENLACGCRSCHTMLDHSEHRKTMLMIFKMKLNRMYPTFTDEMRTYRKGKL